MFVGVRWSGLSGLVQILGVRSAGPCWGSTSGVVAFVTRS